MYTQPMRHIRQIVKVYHAIAFLKFEDAKY